MPASPVRNKADLTLVYTPGVATVSNFVAKNPKRAREYTMKGRMVAVISDGSAVLGLGNIGPLGALPVMEGKGAIFKTFAGVDAIPLVLDTPPFAPAAAGQSRQHKLSVQEEIDFIVNTVIAVAPAFGGINLED